MRLVANWQTRGRGSCGKEQLPSRVTKAERISDRRKSRELPRHILEYNTKWYIYAFSGLEYWHLPQFVQPIHEGSILGTIYFNFQVQRTIRRLDSTHSMQVRRENRDCNSRPRSQQVPH